MINHFKYIQRRAFQSLRSPIQARCNFVTSRSLRNSFQNGNPSLYRGQLPPLRFSSPVQNSNSQWEDELLSTKIIICVATAASLLFLEEIWRRNTYDPVYFAVERKRLNFYTKEEWAQVSLENRDRYLLELGLPVGLDFDYLRSPLTLSGDDKRAFFVKNVFLNLIWANHLTHFGLEVFTIDAPSTILPSKPQSLKDVIIFTGEFGGEIDPEAPIWNPAAGIAYILSTKIAERALGHQGERLTELHLKLVGAIPAILWLHVALASRHFKLMALPYFLIYGAGWAGFRSLARTREQEVDHVGLLIMSKAGYDPHQARIYREIAVARIEQVMSSIKVEVMKQKDGKGAFRLMNNYYEEQKRHLQNVNKFLAERPELMKSKLYASGGNGHDSEGLKDDHKKGTAAQAEAKRVEHSKPVVEAEQVEPTKKDENREENDKEDKNGP